MLQIGDNIKWQLRAAAYDLVLFLQLIVINNSINQMSFGWDEISRVPKRDFQRHVTFILAFSYEQAKPCSPLLHRVECRYNAMQYIMILYKIL